MTQNVNIVKKNNEHPGAFLKRFSQFFRSSGVLPRVKGIKFNERKPSDFKRKKEKIRKINKLAITERNKKLGKTQNK